jgi:hypothetical protein
MHAARPHWSSRTAAFVPPPRRLDVIENELDGEAILVDPRDGNTHRMNATALAVWRQCDGRATTRQIAQEQVRRFEVEFDSALDHVEQLVALFAESRLLVVQEN